eukprot:TRINITY_DN17973_c0_g1_i1.p1 TRINITY_DN17973_c0_g1~~TRINITY_DN17973_c0_g1_i1.p1  ORF type:complete len:540 (+),score=106.77 TRINITY_DN17973_c0_g1_i1:27-1646(+)
MPGAIGLLLTFAFAALIELCTPVSGAQQKGIPDSPLWLSSISSDGDVASELQRGLMRREAALNEQMSQTTETPTADAEEDSAEATATTDEAAESAQEQEVETQGTGIVAAGEEEQLLDPNMSTTADEDNDLGQADDDANVSVGGNTSIQDSEEPVKNTSIEDYVPTWLDWGQSLDWGKQQELEPTLTANSTNSTDTMAEDKSVVPDVVTLRGGTTYQTDIPCVYLPGYKLEIPYGANVLEYYDLDTWEDCFSMCKTAFTSIEGMTCPQSSLFTCSSDNFSGFENLDALGCEAKCRENAVPENCHRHLCTGASFYQDSGLCLLHSDCEQLEKHENATAIVMSVSQPCHQVQFERSAKGASCKIYDDFVWEETLETTMGASYMAAICHPPAGEPGEPGVEGPAGDAGVQGFEGDIGDVGEQGPAGENGSMGPEGAAGEPDWNFASKGDVWRAASLCVLSTLVGILAMREKKAAPVGMAHEQVDPPAESLEGSPLELQRVGDAQGQTDAAASELRGGAQAPDAPAQTQTVGGAAASSSSGGS